MTGEIKTTGQVQPKATFNANVGLQGGYKQLGLNKAIIFGPRGEVGFEHKGWHGKAGLGVGTALTTDLEIGHEFNFNKTLGLDLSASASNTTNLMGRNRSTIVHQEPQGEPVFDTKTWRPNITEAGAKAMLNINPNDNVRVGVGVSGQYVRNNAPDHTFQETTQKFHKEGFRVSPEVAVDIKAGKNITIGADANLRGGNVTVAYNF